MILSYSLLFSLITAKNIRFNDSSSSGELKLKDVIKSWKIRELDLILKHGLAGIEEFPHRISDHIKEHHNWLLILE